MFEILYELKQRKLQHGDLHAGNVLVATSEFDIYERPAFRVTDFAVRELTGQTSHTSDYLHVAEILKQLLELIQYSNCEGRDRYAYDILRKEFLARHLIETDTSADPLASNPRKLLTKLNSVDDQYLKAKKKPVSTLVSPFDYPNCEQIGNSHLLLKSLYSNRLLGLSEIQKTVKLDTDRTSRMWEDHSLSCIEPGISDFHTRTIIRAIYATLVSIIDATTCTSLFQDTRPLTETRHWMFPCTS